MVRSLVLGAAALLVSVAVADDKKDAAKINPTKLVGAYTFVSGVRDGQPVDAKDFKGIAFTITKESMVLKTPDGDFKFGYKIDASKAPAALDLEILDGPVGKGAKAKGIIAQTGGTVKIAYNPMGGDRPKDFDGKKGTGDFSFTVKKAAGKK